MSLFLNNAPQLKQLALSISLVVLSSSYAGYCVAEPIAINYQTKAGSLTHALNYLALQAKVSILFDAKTTNRIQTKAMNGQFTIEQAFEYLLKDTPFHMVKTAGGYLLVENNNSNNSNNSTLSGQSQNAKTKLTGSNETAASHDAAIVVLTPIVVQATEVQRNNQDDVFDQSRLNHELINDERRLVANTVGVSVVENGRSGSNGYAIRGLETDRVAIVVDGMAQAESFMPDVYRGYGYFNGNRNSTEFENISNATIHKGADSFAQGSGALGGSVVFTTKSVDDFLKTNKNWGGLSKLVYDSKNEEFRYVLGGGFKQQDFHGLIQYTQRDGHETKAYGDGLDVYGEARGLADPVDAKNKSWLAKFGYQPSDQHFIEASFEDRKQEVYTTEKSFSEIFGQHRLSEDYSPYRRYRLDYIWTPENSIVKQVKTTLSQQKIEQQSITIGLSKRDNQKDQQYDRKFTQEQKQLSNTIYFQPLSALGAEHQTQLQMQGQSQKFNNINIDKLYNKGQEVHESRYNIIQPVESEVFNLKFLDQITWSDQWKTQLGMRYDAYRHEPEGNENPEKKFNAVSFLSHFTYQPTEQWRLNYQLAQGFRAPKVEELYFKFHRANNHFDPNPDLKAETALNHELSLEFKNNNYRINASAFYSQYRNFIEQRYTEGSAPNPWYDSCKYYGCKEIETLDIYKSVNVDRAKVYGFELQTDINLSQWRLPEGLSVSLNANITKGRNSDGDALRSIQPATGIVQIRYIPESDAWGATWSTRTVAKKKEKDTIITSHTWRGERKHTSKYLSSGYSVSDLTAYYNFNKQTQLNLGVFNLFDKKYSTWDSLRSIPEFGTTNRIDYNGDGLDRFSAPGRNYSVSLIHYF